MPKYVGDSTSTASPGSHSTPSDSASASIVPLVITTSSWPTRKPASAMRFAISRRSGSWPSAGDSTFGKPGALAQRPAREGVEAAVHAPRRSRERAVQRDEIGAAERLEHRVDHLARDAERPARRALLGGRRRELRRAPRRDEVAGPRPRLDEPAPFELQVRLHDRADTHARVPAHRAQRRHALARAQRAAVDLPLDDLRNPLVFEPARCALSPSVPVRKSTNLNLYYTPRRRSVSARVTEGCAMETAAAARELRVRLVDHPGPEQHDAVGIGHRVRAAPHRSAPVRRLGRASRCCSLLCGSGVGAVIVRYPAIGFALKVLGTVYLLYLAWTMRNALEPRAAGRGRAAAEVRRGRGVPVHQSEGLGHGRHGRVRVRARHRAALARGRARCAPCSR